MYSSSNAACACAQEKEEKGKEEEENIVQATKSKAIRGGPTVSSLHILGSKYRTWECMNCSKTGRCSNPLTISCSCCHDTCAAASSLYGAGPVRRHSVVRQNKTSVNPKRRCTPEAARRSVLRD